MNRIKISDSLLETAVESARLKGRTMFDGEGLTRNTNGDWIIIEDVPDRDRAMPICEVRCRSGKKKNGFLEPDPEGLAIARRIVELWNANLPVTEQH